MKKGILFFMLVVGLMIISVSATYAADAYNDILAFYNQNRLQQKLINLARANRELQIILVKLLQEHQYFLGRQIKYQTQALCRLDVRIEIIEFQQRQFKPKAKGQPTAAESGKTLALLKEDRNWLIKGREEYFTAQQENQRALDRYDRKKYFFGTLASVVRQDSWQESWPRLKIQLEKDNDLLIK